MKTSQPKVSVVIPCLDDGYLPATLESLAGQENPPDFEVIVVDASHHDLERRYVSWQDQLNLKFVPVARGTSAPANRNVGVAASVGPFLLMLDADDTVNKTYVRAMSDALEEHEFVCCQLDLTLLNAWNPKGTHPQQTGLITDEKGFGFLPFAGAGTLGIRRQLFEEIGGWDPSLPVYPEADFCWRIQLGGHDGPVLVPDAVLHYRLDPTGGGRWSRAVALGRTQPLLYRRFRHAGMPRPSLAEALRGWLSLLWRLVRRAFGHPAKGLRFQAAIRVGRLQGSLKNRVLYL